MIMAKLTYLATKMNSKILFRHSHLKLFQKSLRIIYLMTRITGIISVSNACPPPSVGTLRGLCKYQMETSSLQPPPKFPFQFLGLAKSLLVSSVYWVPVFFLQQGDMELDLSPKLAKIVYGGNGGGYFAWSPDDLPMLRQGSIGAAKLALEKYGFALPCYSDSAKVAYVLQGIALWFFFSYMLLIRGYLLISQVGSLFSIHIALVLRL